MITAALDEILKLKKNVILLLFLLEVFISCYLEFHVMPQEFEYQLSTFYKKTQSQFDRNFILFGDHVSTNTLILQLLIY